MPLVNDSAGPEVDCRHLDIISSVVEGVFLKMNVILWGVYGPASRSVYVGVGGSLKHQKKA